MTIIQYLQLLVAYPCSQLLPIISVTGSSPGGQPLNGEKQALVKQAAILDHIGVGGVTQMSEVSANANSDQSLPLAIARLRPREELRNNCDPHVFVRSPRRNVLVKVGCLASQLVADTSCFGACSPCVPSSSVTDRVYSNQWNAGIALNGLPFI